jgi:histidyl-tRNA synthetase
MVTALDKWDKIGEEGVAEELHQRQINEDAISKILAYATTNNLDKIGELLVGTQADNGIEELKEVIGHLDNLNISNVNYDPTLARGIDYYTGIIIEAKVDNFPGSLCAGGRYDDLTGLFGLKDVSGVGVSFGADRIYDVMEEEGAFPADITATTQLMLANFGEAEAAYGLGLVTRLREAGVHAELYPDTAKMKKQMAYADAKSIKYVGLIGSDEMAAGKITLKNMATGDQESVTEEELINVLNA